MSDMETPDMHGGRGRNGGAKATQQLFSIRPQMSFSPEEQEEEQVDAEISSGYALNDEVERQMDEEKTYPGSFAEETGEEELQREEAEYYEPNEPEGVRGISENVFADEESFFQDTVKPPLEGDFTGRYYRRPVGEEPEGDFSEGPHFAVPVASAEGMEDVAAPIYSPGNIYQPKVKERIEEEPQELQAFRQAVYQVEEEAETHGRFRIGKRFLLLILFLLAIGAAVYFGRDWIRTWVGGQTPAAVTEMPQTTEEPDIKGYDAAPMNRLNEKAEKGILAVGGMMNLEIQAVTGSHIIAREETGDGVYDDYLFDAQDGRLLGYYEGLSAAGFVPQPEDTFYLETTPYLVNGQGKPLLNLARFVQYVGETPVVSPFENGWAILGDAEGTKFNYVNEQGELFSSLWFERVFPFYGDYTVAYVDSGNTAKPESRYALYVLSAEGEMTRWEYAENTEGVLGAACDTVLMKTGELISLRDTDNVICRAEEVTAYLDCRALIVRDAETGKYGMFVKGEQHYDFLYDKIEPVVCDIQWKRVTNDTFTFCAVTNAKYPQPLAHYFQLEKDGTAQQVALSTRSVYPVILP